MRVPSLERFPTHSLYRYIVAFFWTAVICILFLQLRHLKLHYNYGLPGTDDLIAYWSAGQLLLSGHNPYDVTRLHELEVAFGYPLKVPLAMWNPPWLLIWILPLLVLPFPVAAVCWLAINGSLILLSSSLIWRTFTDTSVQDTREKSLGVAWIASAAFIPALMTLRMGQVSSLLLLAVAGFLYFESRKRDFLAGFFLPLALIKPHVIYLVWISVLYWTLRERRWKVLAGCTALFLPTLAVLTLMWPDWFAIYRTAAARPPLAWRTATLGSFLRQVVYWDDPLSQDAWRLQFLPSLVSVIYLLGWFLLRRPRLNWRTHLGPLLLVSSATAPYGWAFDQIVLLVPYLTIIFWLETDSGHRTLRLFGASALILVIAAMAFQTRLKLDDMFFFWPPLAFAALYFCILWRRQRTSVVS